MLEWEHNNKKKNFQGTSSSINIYFTKNVQCFRFKNMCVVPYNVYQNKVL